jgi:hypothetical protein
VVQDQSDDALAEFRENRYADGLVGKVYARSQDFTLAPLGEIKVENRAAVGVKVSSKGHRDVNLYFDKETGLQVKTETQAKDVLDGREFKSETLILEYQDVQGMKYPAKLKVFRDGALYVESEMTDVKLVDRLDDSKFARP